MFYGRGRRRGTDRAARSWATSSRSPATGSAAAAARARAPTPTLPMQPMGEVATRYHVALDVADEPGVLAAVAQVFADHGVSIQTVRQEGRGDAATLVLVTHTATDRALTDTVARARRPAVRRARRQRDAGRGRVGDEADVDGGSLMASGPGSSRRTATACRSARDAGRHPVRGRHAAGAGPRAVRAHRVRGLPQGRGRQPHRFVQGPRHDDGHLARRPRTVRRPSSAPPPATPSPAPRPTRSGPG